MLCKTIILSNSQNLNSNSPKGILTLTKENRTIKGKIRLYNIISLPVGAKLGLYINQTVHTCALTKRPNHYEFDLNVDADITQNIYCALIDNSNMDKKVLLEGGSFNGFYFTDSPFDAVLEAKDEQLEQTIDSALQQTEDCAQCSCADCEYKKYFYANYLSSAEKSQSPIHNKENSNTLNAGLVANGDVPPANDEPPQQDLLDNIQSSVVEMLENEIIDDVHQLGKKILQTNPKTEDTSTLSNQNDAQTNESTQFLNDIIYQLDEMLNSNPEDELLNNIIPNSRFVRVESESPYVLGVIYENDHLKYIAYGVPAQYNTLPPADLGDNYQWLPLNPRDVMSDGYFMIYQDAVNGNIVEINFE